MPFMYTKHVHHLGHYDINMGRAKDSSILNFNEPYIRQYKHVWHVIHMLAMVTCKRFDLLQCSKNSKKELNWLANLI